MYFFGTRNKSKTRCFWNICIPVFVKKIAFLGVAEHLTANAASKCRNESPCSDAEQAGPEAPGGGQGGRGNETACTRGGDDEETLQYATREVAKRLDH